MRQTLIVVLCVGLLSCRIERARSTDERLANLPSVAAPVAHTVELRWNAQQVPYVVAATEGDLAFGLGVAQAHLRLGQMEIMRHIAQGRLSEVLGPLGYEVDHALRILDFAGAALKMEAALPEATRVFVQRFVDGINFQIAHQKELPPELDFLGVEMRAWEVHDVLSIGRLASADVNWFHLFSYFRSKDRAQAERVWVMMQKVGSHSVASYGERSVLTHLEELLSITQDSGSNAFVIDAEHSQSGAPLLGSDPHLGLSVPNFWMLAGLKSPATSCVGLMIPGLPFVAVGRTPGVAWGGTNMRTASSDIYDVTSLPESAFRKREEVIKVRFVGERRVTIRETDYGPVVSDSEVLGGGAQGNGRIYALKWVGQEPSDELSAFIGANRARDAWAFRAAFRTYAVSGQNLLYGDVKGTIGFLPAAAIPQRSVARPLVPVLDAANPEQVWTGLIRPLELPYVENPPAGFLASANNQPYGQEPAVGYGFSANDRVERLATRIGGQIKQGAKLDLAAVKELHEDTYVETAKRLSDLFVARIEAVGGDPLLAAEREYLASLKSWDGHYGERSAGAADFERLLGRVARRLLEAEFDAEGVDALLGSEYAKRLTLQLIEQRPLAEQVDLVRWALRRTAAEEPRGLVWGDLHRLRLVHPLGSLPWIGRLLTGGVEFGVQGSSETLLKMAHPLATGARRVTYGQNARFVADLADADSGAGILLGGADGWLGSAAYFDQVELWRRGEYLPLPLSSSGIDRHFPRVTRLRAP